MKNRVLYSDASKHEKKLAVQQFQSVTARVKGRWLECRSDELCEMASKDPKGFWRAFETRQSNVCPVELAAQFKAFRALEETYRNATCEALCTRACRATAQLMPKHRMSLKSFCVITAS